MRNLAKGNRYASLSVMSTITAILQADADGTLHVPVPEELRHGKIRITAIMEPAPEDAPRAKAGVWSERDGFWMAPDFDEPMDDFLEVHGQGMTLLLDTHAALWFFQADPRLPASTRVQIEEAGTAAHVSMASLWEIAIKVSLNKLNLPGEFETLFPGAITESGLTLLPIRMDHLACTAPPGVPSSRPVRPAAHRTSSGGSHDDCEP